MTVATSPAAPALGVACLEANLVAIGLRDSLLVQRIALPVTGGHVRMDAAGASYRHRGEWLRLDLTGEEVARALAAVDGAPAGLVVFGLGVGELLVAAARRWKGTNITVWERDPWLLRLFLMRVDCADVIRAGRLRFALLGDLVDLAGGPEAVVVHPLLGRVYPGELSALREGLGPRRALVCAGELFVDDVSDALAAEGLAVLTLDTGLLAVEEMALLVRQVGPELVACVNYKEGLAEFCHALGVPLVSWEVDPTTDGIAAPDGPVGAAHLFTYRASQVEAFRRAGFPNVTYLPLAANPGRRRSVALDEVERARYAADVAFAGASMVASAARYRARFVEIVAAGEEGDLDEARADVERRLDAVLDAQRADFATWRVPALLAEAFPDLRGAWIAAGSSEDPVMLVGEIAAAEKRRAYVSALAPLGIHVWGDDGWVDLDGGVRYRGAAGHLVELTKIYGAARVNVDVGRLYQSDIVPMRVFDVLSTGGFVLAEHSDALADLFTVGHDIESYRTRDELVDKAAWYVAHVEEATAIARRGRERVWADHTIRARVRTMLAAAKAAKGSDPPT